MKVFDFQTGGAEPLSIALGFFDCLHLGHAALLSAAERLARDAGRVEMGGKSGNGVGKTEVMPAVFTFRSDPFRGGKSVYTFSERADVLAERGGFALVAADFDEALRSTPAEKFLDELFGRFPIRAAVCGEDFRFGAGAKGDAAMLAEYAAARGAKCEVAGEVSLFGSRVSTSRVRDLLSRGDVEGAARLLGAPYRVKAEVKEGRKVGRTIGFPTLNFALPPEKFLPKEGVYAVHARFPSGERKGLANLGPCPTFGVEERRLEVWLKDFGGELYGETVTVFFDRWLRGIRAFGSAEELRRQLSEDRARIE